MAQRILLVEDEPGIAEVLIYALRSEGFDVAWVTTGEEALSLIEQKSPHLLLLDIGLPDSNGFDLCRRLRQNHRLPLLFLTARNSETDRVVGLEIGGDDYIVKPFSPREVCARVRAVLRRSEGGELHAPRPQNSLGLLVDKRRQRVTFEGRDLGLTRNELRLFQVLHAQPERVFGREELLKAAWEDPGASMDRTVDAHIKSLRSKLRQAGCPELIATHRGLGYSCRLEAKSNATTEREP